MDSYDFDAGSNPAMIFENVFVDLGKILLGGFEAHENNIAFL